MINNSPMTLNPPSIPGSVNLTSASVQTSLIEYLHVGEMDVIELDISQEITIDHIYVDSIIVDELFADNVLSDHAILIDPLVMDDIKCNIIHSQEINVIDVETDKFIVNEIEGTTPIIITPNNHTVLNNFVTIPDLPMFFAYLSTATYNYGNVNNPFIFDQVLLNNGNCYDPSTGIFTAPVTGLYTFNGLLQREVNTTFNATIQVNSSPVFQCRMNGTATGLSTPFEYTNLFVQAGEEVFIRSNQTGNFVGGTYVSRFSGYLETSL